MNEIVILPDGSRTITGELAHFLAFGPSWPLVLPQVRRDRFCVFEGAILKASQSTVRLAWSYLTDERVLVYFH